MKLIAQSVRRGAKEPPGAECCSHRASEQPVRPVETYTSHLCNVTGYAAMRRARAPTCRSSERRSLNRFVAWISSQLPRAFAPLSDASREEARKATKEYVQAIDLRMQY